MAEESGSSALGGTTESLSQLMARVLGQLSLSAWLPSAALTVLVAFVVDLGTVLDRATIAKTHKTNIGVWDAVTASARKLGGTGATGLILLVVMIVVLTMLTQAFSFEAIRLLEGYWGTNPIVERAAQSRADHHRRVVRRLNARLERQRLKAWLPVMAMLERVDDRLAENGRPPEYGAVLLAAVDLTVRNPWSDDVTEYQRALVREFDWESFAAADWSRRELNIAKRLDDYPVDRNMQPTRLGNVLRHFEDETHLGEVESFIDRVYSSLPSFLQVSHDEQRGRLDLYCSMIFVFGLVAGVAVARFHDAYPGYSAAAFASGVAGSALSYRAAIASARYYGQLVVTIAELTAKQPSGPSSVERLRTRLFDLAHGLGRMPWRPAHRGLAE